MFAEMIKEMVPVSEVAAVLDVTEFEIRRTAQRQNWPMVMVRGELCVASGFKLDSPPAEDDSPPSSAQPSTLRSEDLVSG